MQTQFGDNPAEVLDLVDEHDVVIGRKLRAEIYAEGLSNFRVVNLLIQNTKGQLWIPRRTATKKLFPLHLDMSAAGHVESGETYDEAMQKEAREELNIDLTVVPATLLGKLSPQEHDVSAHMQVYKIISDVVPNFNTDDFMEYLWLTPEELLSKIAEGELAKSDLSKIVRLFFALEPI